MKRYLKLSAIILGVIALIYVLAGTAWLFIVPSYISPAEATKIFLPPQKSERHAHLESLMRERGLTGTEMSEYNLLSDRRNENFLEGKQISVSQALAGIKAQRKTYLTSLLQERGLTDNEISLFIGSIIKENPELLKDLP